MLNCADSEGKSQDRVLGVKSLIDLPLTAQVTMVRVHDGGRIRIDDLLLTIVAQRSDDSWQMVMDVPTSTQHPIQTRP